MPDLRLYGVSGLSAASYLATPIGGGEVGSTAGFGAAVLFRLDAITAVTRYLHLSLGTSNGYMMLLESGVLARMYAKTGVGAAQAGSTWRTLVASDVGKIFLIVGRHTGASNLLEFFADRGSSGQTAIASYAPSSGNSALIGANSNAPDGVTILGAMDFRGVPTVAQLQAYYDVARALGDLPSTLDGATVTHRWSAKEELRGVSNPAGRLTYGARAASAANYFSCAAGIAGHASGFSVAWDGVLDPNLDATNRTLVSKRLGADGWRITAASGSIGFWVYDGAGALKTASVVPVSADFGVRIQIVATWDGTTPRIYFRRAETVGAAGTAGFTASSEPTRLFRSGASGDEAVYATCFGVMGGSGAGKVFTLAEAVAVFDDVERTGTLQPNAKCDHFWDLSASIAANGNAMPSTLAERIAGTDTMSRSGALEVAINVASAPACPLQLTDRVTIAAGDALARVGSPSIKIIDPTIDGRRTLGAHGFSAANYLDAGAGKGVQGAASGGFWGAIVVRFDVIGAVTQILAHAINPTFSAGWWLGLAAGALKFSVSNGSWFSSAAYTPVAADVGIPMLVAFQLSSAGAVRLFVRRAQVGADTIGAALTVSGTGMQLGQWNAQQGFANGAILGFSGGNGSPTLAQIQQAFDDFDQTQRVPTIAGLTDHRYDLSLDVLASGVDAVPATVLDRVGTDHLTRQGIDVRTDANSIRGVGPYSGADYWQTAINGGIQGASSGFHACIDVWWTAIPAGNQMQVYCANAAVTTGWYVQISGASLRAWVLIGGVAVGSPTYTLTSGDLNKRFRITVNKTASVWQFFVNGVQIGSDVAAVTYSANTNVAMLVGALSATSQPFASGYVEAIVGGNVALTAGNVATYNADLTQAPPTIASVTQKRWLFEQDIAAAGGSLPARSTERVSGGDDLTRIGSPLVLAQRAERVWSYESSPIIYGGQGFDGTKSWSGASSFAGALAGFHVTVALRIDSQAVASRARRLVYRTASGVGGFSISSNGTNTTLFMGAIGAALGGGSASPSAVVSSSDVGKVMVFTGVYNGSALFAYWKRAAVAGSTALAGYIPYTAAPLYLGKDAAGVEYADGLTIFGVAMGNTIPSLSEIQAQSDAIIAADGDIRAIPGKTEKMWSINASQSGGVLQSLTELIAGGDTLTQNGTVTPAPTYARAMGY